MGPFPLQRNAKKHDKQKTGPSLTLEEPSHVWCSLIAFRRTFASSTSHSPPAHLSITQGRDRVVRTRSTERDSCSGQVEKVSEQLHVQDGLFSMITSSTDNTHVCLRILCDIHASRKENDILGFFKNDTTKI